MKNPQNFERPLKYIKAMELLIEDYKEAKRLGVCKRDLEIVQARDGHPCPLCSLTIGCDSCPWQVILGGVCGSRIYNSADPIILERRIKQLRNWIKIYKKEALKREMP